MGLISRANEDTAEGELKKGKEVLSIMEDGLKKINKREEEINIVRQQIIDKIMIYAKYLDDNDLQLTHKGLPVRLEEMGPVLPKKGFSQLLSIAEKVQETVLGKFKIK